MPFIAAVIMTGIYMYNLPLMIAFMWREQGFGVGVGVIEPAYALKVARSHIINGKKRAPGRKRKPGMTLKMIRSLRIEYFSARLYIGTGDAAATALLCGAARSLAGVLAGAARQSVTDIRPEFSGNCLRGEAAIVFSVTAGRILKVMLAHAIGKG